MYPKVSILIPSYNTQQWLEQAIASALAQSYPNTEVIVVDDGSTDNSLEIIRGFGDRIYWETTRNRGGNPTRNRLLELSSGEWLQYLDSDDYLLSDKIAQQIEFIDRYPQTDLVYSPSIIQHHYSHNDIVREVLPIPQPHDPWILLAKWYLPQTGSPLWRRQAIIDVGGWKEDQPCCQEHELYLRLLQNCKNFSYFERAGSVYRQWSESTVCRKNQAQTYRKRLEIVDRLEKHLARTDELNLIRQTAINQARFECARIIWLTDKQWSSQIIQQITRTQSDFVPAKITPAIYRWLYRNLGFNSAETVARIKRQIAFNR